MQYMVLGRYEPAVLKTLLDNPHGLAARLEQAVSQLYGSVDGKVLHWWFVRNADWHFMVVVDFPDAEAAHTAAMIGYATGAYQALKLTVLATPEETVSTLRRASAVGEVFYPPTASEVTA
ncbi:MAG: GYD domain-containing protein [Egibacteraceae bacterium]